MGKKHILSIVGFIIAILAYSLIKEFITPKNRNASLSTSQYYSNPLEKIKKERSIFLQQMKDKCNAECPAQIDSITTFDSTSFSINDNSFTYHYTLKLDRKKYNSGVLKKDLGERIYEDFIDKPSFDIVKVKEITIIYQYNDWSGNLWFRQTFSPKFNYLPER